MKNKHRPLILLPLIALATAGAVFLALSILKNPDTTTSPDSSSGINYRPPTADEIKSGENIKDTNQEKNHQNPTVYSIAIVDAAQYGQNLEIRSFIEGIIRDGGTCTYLFKKEQATLIKTSPGSADAAHTNCAPLIVPVSEFASSGTWQLSITYTFDGITASSTTQTVEVNQ